MPSIYTSHSYATDGKCHNANAGTFGHECRKPATWLATNSRGFTMGVCDRCKTEGDEARGCTFVLFPQTSKGSK